MSSTSSNDLSRKNLIESLSQNDGSQRTSNSVQGMDDKSSRWINPSNPSMGMRFSPVSISENSINEKIESAVELEDVETSTKNLQAGYDSFASHTYSNYDEKISFYSNQMIEAQVSNEDLRLPLAEEQDASFDDSTKNLCTDKKHTHRNDPIENLVSATLAFKEASHNQCDLLRAQTSAINRLATAIEDQNVMMTRFHTFVEKKSTEHIITSNDVPLRREDKH